MKRFLVILLLLAAPQYQVMLTINHDSPDKDVEAPKAPDTIDIVKAKIYANSDEISLAEMAIREDYVRFRQKWEPQ